MSQNHPENTVLNRIKLITPATKLKMAASHHIESFNLVYQQGLKKIVENLSPMELLNGEIQTEGKTVRFPFQKLKVAFESVTIGKPLLVNDATAKHLQIYPQDCRLAGKTYSAPLICQVMREIDEVWEKFTVTLGELPLMVRSKHCQLYGLSPEDLVKQNEDPTEYGGYFIVNGNEKIIRMLLLQKRNFPVGFIRSSYSNRGTGYTQYAVQMRCVREDYFARTFTLHYINDGNIFLRLLYKKQEFLIPLIIILKALGNFSDLEIYKRLLRGTFSDSSRSDKVQVLIKSGKGIGYSTKQHCMRYLGSSFRHLINIGQGYSDIEAGETFLNENICIHLRSNLDKFNTLCLMVDKLYSLVDGSIQPDNLDSLANQEILLPGHLYLMILREKLEDCLSGLRARIIKDCSHEDSKKVRQSDYMKKTMEATGITKQIQSFLSTGNLRSRTGLDLMQDKGYTVIADKLNNMRFLSHFRSVHRGAYFAEMKTTTVRKLLPESWGFLCPVHTPDGGPCGLLNHLALNSMPQCKDASDAKTLL